MPVANDVCRRKDMFFVHRVMNAVTMMYNEADEITACHFIRPSTYWKHRAAEPETQQSVESSDEEQPLNLDKDEPKSRDEPS